jgi:hypothetical protein
VRSLLVRTQRRNARPGPQSKFPYPFLHFCERGICLRKIKRRITEAVTRSSTIISHTQANNCHFNLHLFLSPICSFPFLD